MREIYAPWRIQRAASRRNERMAGRLICWFDLLHIMISERWTISTHSEHVRNDNRHCKGGRRGIGDDHGVRTPRSGARKQDGTSAGGFCAWAVAIAEQLGPMDETVRVGRLHGAR